MVIFKVMSILIDNRKAKFNYELLDEYEAGIQLLGTEVKSLKNKRGNFTGSFISLSADGAYLKGAEIPAYQEANAPEDYNPTRPRKLLLSKKELVKLAESEKTKGLTLIPLTLYNKGSKLKVSFAVARGKSKTDKRQTILKREADRDIHRTLKKLR
jgi:SsrA-binding protein